MIQYVTGNLLKANAQALVNTVNCVGVMGKGIALQFKQAFPDCFKAYAKACKQETVTVGHMHIYPTGHLINPQFIINFPTKKHWRNASELEYIEQGLIDLKQHIQQLNIRSIAIPPLGCGNGGLAWDVVKERIEHQLAELTDVEVFVYAPNNASATDQIVINTKKPSITRARALFIKLMDLYSKPNYRLSLLEIQKLAYFLQEAGEPLRLNYKKHIYGPYAENLNHVLQHMDGHYIRGYGDRSKDAELYLTDNALHEADSYLAQDTDAQARLKQVAALIDGFETPYGMELLATIHWLMRTTDNHSYEALETNVKQWNNRKAKIIKPYHIKVAKDHLMENGWCA